MSDVGQHGITIALARGGGAIPTPTCIVNAVEDAIAHLGGRVVDSHLTPARVLQAIRATRLPAG